MIIGVYINSLGWPLKISQVQVKFKRVSIIESCVRESIITLVIFFSVFNKNFSPPPCRRRNITTIGIRVMASKTTTKIKFEVEKLEGKSNFLL